VKKYYLQVTESLTEWEQWDHFGSNSKRGIYLQLSDWLRSYRAYGFEEILIIAKDSSGQILGGMGVFLAKAGLLKILVTPYGPIWREEDASL
jgi:hypothetical protein